MQLKKDLIRCSSVALCFLTPLLIFSDPVKSHINFERLAEFFYPTIAFHSEPNARNAKIAILEIDEKAEKEFGWPMSRQIFARTFADLKQHSGYPTVVSLLHFQEKVGTDGSEDKTLEDAIAKYGKYMSSSVLIDETSTSKLTDAERSVLQSKALLTSGTPATNADYPMLKFDEATRFIQNAIATGVAPRFGIEPIIYCMQMNYPEVINRTGESIVSTVALAAAIVNQTNLMTSDGVQKVWKQQRPPLHIANKHCLSSPRIDTETFLKIRGIERVSLADYLASPKNYSFTGKAVILTSSKMRLFQGPRGPLRNSQSGIVPEHLLTARFIDDMINNTSLKQEPQKYQQITQQASQVILVALACFAFYASIGSLVLLATGATATMIGMSLVTANVLQDFYIPVAGISSFFLATVLAGICLTVQRTMHATKRMQFNENARKELSLTQNIEQLFATAEQLLSLEFSKVKIEYSGENLELLAMVNDPKKYLAQKDVKAERKHQDRPTAKRGKFSQLKRKRNLFLIGRSTNIELTFPCFDKDGWFGEINLQANYLYWERHYSISILKTMCEEITNNWYRIELQALQKIKDFEVLNLHSKSEILGRFLTKNIVNRFNDHNFASSELTSILTPRRCKVAIMQADVRGYSSIFKDRDPLQVIAWLKSFYEKVIDEASEYAQVKLVGDCIFLFIEEQNEQPYQALLQTFQVAVKLIETTVKNNQNAAAAGMPQVNFGIAINYGDVIVGNLSSDHCIDYTIIGSQANRTARLEELTKHAAVKEMVRENAILLSEEAAQPLQKLLKTSFRQLKLDDLGASVRSFPDTKTVWFAHAEDVLTADTQWLKAG